MAGDEPPPFSLDVEERDGRVLLTPRGELDMLTAGELESAVLPVVRDGREAVVDLRELDFMDSSGVRVLVAAHAAAGREGGGRLTIVRAPAGSEVQRVLEVSGLEGLLHLVDRP